MAKLRRAASQPDTLAADVVGEPTTPNLAFGLIAVFACIWIATSGIKKP